jgi:folate-binding Fe-S cluster repair protein YgfZ
MHADWIDFLKTQDLLAQTPTDTQAILAPLTHLTVLTVSGKDAASFLQGQTTCDINVIVQGCRYTENCCQVADRGISDLADLI